MNISDASDEDIARIVQEGDTDAFGALVTRYEAKLKRYARKFLSRKEDIEDLVQDVFVKAYEHIQSFDTSLRFSPWIYRIAHNVFVNELKRANRLGFSIFDPYTLLPFLSARETADGEVINEEVRRQIDVSLETLSPKYREILILHYFEELSYKEISEVLHIPVTTVGVRMTRARERLRHVLNEDTYLEKT